MLENRHKPGKIVVTNTLCLNVKLNILTFHVYLGLLTYLITYKSVMKLFFTFHCRTAITKKRFMQS